jgi:maleylpyruvate isomerase
MKLYGFWRSTATWRVRIALAYKGLAYTYVPVHLRRDGGEQNRPEFAEKNPMRQVPVLELDDGGREARLTQSLAIIEYLEERFPAPSLLPKERLARAQARRIAETINAGIQPLQNTGVQLYLENVLHADAAGWNRHWVTKGLAALESSVRESAGELSVGDSVTVADVCLVPQLYFARRFALDLAPYATLLRVEAACAKLPAFVAAHAENQIDRE